MYDHFSARSLSFLRSLLSGAATRIGGQELRPFTAEETALLSCIAKNFGQLRGLRGVPLVTFLEKCLESAGPEDLPTALPPADAAPSETSYRLGLVRSCSFRGIAPAKCAWEFDFTCHSHFLYGPNGSGKSSLLGAICWCLTGQLLRDDRPPCAPQLVPTYTSSGSGASGTSKKSKALKNRPDALTLQTADGSLSDVTEPFEVSVQLIPDAPEGGRELWIRRHSADGLSTSEDGSDWTSISSLTEVGISPVDAELHFLLPARVSTIRFGKDSEALRLFSQIVGLDSLETIANIAASAHTASSKEANHIEKDDVPRHQRAIKQTSEALEGHTPESVRISGVFRAALAQNRSSSGVAQLAALLDDALSAARTRLASDLGIALPEDATGDSGTVLAELDYLPGHIDAAAHWLRKPLSALFPQSIGLRKLDPQSLGDVTSRLNAFDTTARTRIRERLDWARKEQSGTASGLVLAAAGVFDPETNECPVCGQSLAAVPAVGHELTTLRPLAAHIHLHQRPIDLQRTLLAELDSIVSVADRNSAASSIADRVMQDWDALSDVAFQGLVRSVVSGADARVRAVVDALPDMPTRAHNSFSEGFEDFPGVFDELDAETRKAWAVVALQHAVAEVDAGLERDLSEVLNAGPESMSELLARGQATTSEIKCLEQSSAAAASLLASQIALEAVEGRIARLRQIAASLDAIKSLAKHVRQETADLVRAVEPRMKELYSALYDQDHLSLDLVTTGHAANPDIRDEFNVYLRTSTACVPAGPFANAGRLRALALCFVFSLLDRSSNTVPVLMLDDPALSLDDEHKARALDVLIAPLAASRQVILATHYESFFKLGEGCMQDAVRIQLVPRRRHCDVISFEPGDLLERLNKTLQSSSSTWREMAINIRRYGERTLRTLSGFCPEPFVVFNNIVDSINAYASIADLRVATERRDRIVSAFRSAAFRRIVHRAAHDEEPTEAEVRDALHELTACRDDVRSEIERFRQLYHHALERRSIGPKTDPDPLVVDVRVPRTEIRITAHAAAASHGVGISWSARETCRLAEQQVVLVKSDSLSPIALPGQLLLLDAEDRMPIDGDLVAVRDANARTYLRRFWKRGKRIYLESANPVSALGPEVLEATDAFARRIVGVLFNGLRVSRGAAGGEWVVPGSFPAGKLADVAGVRVEGDSLEPIARDGQVVLVERREPAKLVPDGDLLLVDVEQRGAFLKRVYKANGAWVMCSVNPVTPEEPVVVAPEEINHAYEVAGVLFECSSAADEE